MIDKETVAAGILIVALLGFIALLMVAFGVLAVVAMIGGIALMLAIVWALDTLFW